jgi:hypothetical protein
MPPIVGFVMGFCCGWLAKKTVITEAVKSTSTKVQIQTAAEKPKPPFNIVVNGRKIVCPYVELCYDDILEYAEKTGQPTMTYWITWRGTGGILHPGEIIPTAEGMIFNAYHAGNA